MFNNMYIYMQVDIKNKRLQRMEIDFGFNDGTPPNIIRAYRKLVNNIRTAETSNDLRALRSLRFEKLKGKRKHQHSLRVNDQYRLVVELGKKDGKEIIVIIDIEDYHK